MMIGACGMACGVCQMREPCGGCVSGTDPEARQRAERIREIMGAPCPVLECAMSSQVDYCLSCTRFPCELHFKAEIPYSRKLLGILKKFKEENLG